MSSRRGAKRNSKRMDIMRSALLMWVSTVFLAGPSIKFCRDHSSSAFATLLKRGRRKARSSYYLTSLLCVPARKLFILPGWATTLYNHSALGRDRSAQTAWAHVLSMASLFCCRVRSSAKCGNPSEPPTIVDCTTPDMLFSIFNQSYSQTTLERQNLVEPLSLSKVSIPSEGHEPVPLQRFLQPPFLHLFSPEGFATLEDDSKVDLLPQVPAFDLFESEEARVSIYQQLNQRGMMLFRPTTAAHGLPNGCFGMVKTASRQRLLVDLRRGNFTLRSMSHLQAAYEVWLQEDPGRAARLRARGFELVNPSSFSDLPPDVCVKAGSDLSDFFHFIQVPPHIMRHQQLAPLKATSLGLDEARWGMGHSLPVNACHGFYVRYHPCPACS